MANVSTSSTTSREISVDRPLVIVGAGPIGLAAAAQAQARGLATVVLEAGPAAGAAVGQWGHVRLFSAWSELVDPAADKLLTSTGWSAPDPTSYPTGAEWVSSYLAPLAAALTSTDEVDLRYGHRVVALAKSGRDRLVDYGRDDAAFTVHVQTPTGRRHLTAGAVIDATGTWHTPSPLGGDGVPAVGEGEHADRISYGIPDLTDPDARARYAGKRVAVAGTGASAQNVLVALDRLAQDHPGTSVVWLVRRAAVGDAFGGGDNDQLVARGALGKAAETAAASQNVDVVTSFRTAEVAGDGTSLRLVGFDGQSVDGIDEVVVVTGFRPDLGWLAEVRLDLDPVLSAPRELAPLIDPNLHSCGTVYPHGASVLAQPEPGLYLAGMKSYGRAPSFLALTGFEQTRSVVAEIAGDHEAAARVELVLPESGVCGGSGDFDGASEGGGCCAPSALGVTTAPQLITIGGPATAATAQGDSCCG